MTRRHSFSPTWAFPIARPLLAAVLALLVLAAPDGASARQPLGAVLLEDDFSENGSGWTQEDIEYWRVGYDSEEYFVVTFPVAGRSGGVFSFGFLTSNLTDYLAEVYVRMPNYGEGERAALGVRWSERGFVGLTVAPSLGHCSLIRFVPREDAGYRGVALVPEAECAGVNVGPGWNRLALRVEGHRYVGLINGYPVLEAADDFVQAGGFALVVAGPADFLTEGRFDNFRVTALAAP